MRAPGSRRERKSLLRSRGSAPSAAPASPRRGRIKLRAHWPDPEASGQRDGVSADTGGLSCRRRAGTLPAPQAARRHPTDSTGVGFRHDACAAAVNRNPIICADNGTTRCAFERAVRAQGLISIVWGIHVTGAAPRRCSPRAGHEGHATLSAGAHLVAGGVEDAQAPLFQSVDRSRRLSGRSLTRRVVLAMIKRRAAAAGLPASTCCHTFRATGITAYLSNGGTLEHAQQIAGHASPRTTKLYDRTADTVTLDEDRTHRDLTGRARPGWHDRRSRRRCSVRRGLNCTRAAGLAVVTGGHWRCGEPFADGTGMGLRRLGTGPARAGDPAGGHR